MTRWKDLRHGEGWLASHPEREAITRLGKLGYVAAEVTRRTGSEESVEAAESTSSRR